MTPEQATQAWIAAMGPEAIARSNAYFEGGYWLLLLGWAVAVAAAALLIWIKALPRLRDRLEGGVKNEFAQGAILAGAFIGAMTALSLPLDLYQGYFREHAFGLATQTLGEWMGEHLMGTGINLALGSLLIGGLYMIVKRAGTTWWLWGAGLTGAVMALMIMITPVFIAPLFNTYTPMEPGPLRDDILAMAQANGVPAEDVYVYDESRQSNRVTANVSGLFGTTRIALADTLVSRVSPDGVRMVMAHEIGHYVLHHVVSILLFTLGLIAAAFALLNVIMKRIIGNGRWGVRSVHDPAGLPVAAAVLVSVLTLATPVQNAITRFHEHQADIFGINASREPQGFAETALLLSEYRKMQPGPLERLLFYTHPSGYDRIHMAMTWQVHEMEAGRFPQTPLGPPPGYRPDFAANGQE